MITARQIRAARALLNWSQQDLADKAIVSINAIARLERGSVDPRMSTIAAVQKAMTKAGIEFLSADDKRGEGVRLFDPPEGTDVGSTTRRGQVGGKPNRR